MQNSSMDFSSLHARQCFNESFFKSWLSFNALRVTAIFRIDNMLSISYSHKRKPSLVAVVDKYEHHISDQHNFALVLCPYLHLEENFSTCQRYT